jgi:hypothetical protein
MKALVKVFALLVVLGLVGSAEAKKEAGDNAAAPKVKPLRGVVKSVDGTNVTVTVKVSKEESKDVVVATDDKTEVTIDGQAGKVADLKAGQRVTVLPPEGTATKIAASTPRPKKEAAPKG